MKKIIGLLFMFIFVSLTALASDDVEVETKVILSENISPFEVKPGDEINISIPVKTRDFLIDVKGYVDIPNDLMNNVEVSGDVVLYKNGVVASYKSLDYGNNEFKFVLKVKSNTKKGVYKIPFSITGVDKNGKIVDLKLDRDIKLNVLEEKKDANIYIKDIDVPYQISLGSEVKISFGLENVGELAAKNISVSLDGIEDISFSSVKEYGSLAAKSENVYIFPVKFSKNITDTIKVVELKVKYETADGVEKNISEKFPLNFDAVNKDGNGLNLYVSKVIQDNDNPIAGENVKLKVILNNNSNKDIKQLKVKFDNEQAYYSGQSSYIYVGPLNKNDQKELEFTVNLSKNAIEKVNVMLDMEAILENGQRQEIKESIQIKNIQKSVMSDLYVDKFSVNKSVINPNDNIDVELVVKNVSDKDMTNVKFTLDNIGKYYPRYNNDLVIKEIKKGEKRKIVFPITISETVENNILEFKVNYSQDNSDIKNIVLYIKGLVKSDTTSEIPKIIISDYKSNIDKIFANDDFNLELSVLNTNESKQVKNIKITLTPDNDSFRFREGSHSFYLNSIPPKGIDKIVVPLKARPDAASKTYDINIKFEYDYEGMKVTEKNTGVSVDDKISIYVNEKPKLSIRNIGFDTTLIANNDNAVIFDLINEGRSELYNISAYLESEALKKGKSNIYSIGKLEASAGNNVSIDISPIKEGDFKGKLIIKFENSLAEVQVIKKKVELNVQPFIEEELPSDSKNENVKTPIMPIYVFLGIGIVLFFVGYKVSLKVFKNKSVDDLDE